MRGDSSRVSGVARWVSGSVLGRRGAAFVGAGVGVQVGAAEAVTAAHEGGGDAAFAGEFSDVVGGEARYSAAFSTSSIYSVVAMWSNPLSDFI